MSWFAPRVYPQIAARTIPFLPTVGVKGFYCESYPYWAHTASQLYLATRLLWNADLEPDDLLDEWYAKMFKEVAPQIRDYFETLERSWTDLDHDRDGKWFLGLNHLALQLSIWKSEDRDEAWKKINLAYSLAENEITRRRVDYVRNGNRLAYLLSKTLEKVHDLKSDYNDLEDRVTDVLANVNETIGHFRSKIESDQTYGSAYYRDDRAETRLKWWRGYIAKIIEDALDENPELRLRFSDDATFREMIEVADHPDIPRQIEEARKIFSQ